MNKGRSDQMDRATESARRCWDYSDVNFFRSSELLDIANANYPTGDLDRLALRTALSNVLEQARMDAVGYRNEAERQETVQLIEGYKSDALKLVKELGMDPGVIEQKFDEIELEPYKDMDTMMREWYPNPFTRAYVKLSDRVKQSF